MSRGRKPSLRLTPDQVISFQRALQRWMESENYSVKDVAEMTGFSPEYIKLLLGAYKDNYRRPSANVLEALAQCGLSWTVSKTRKADTAKARKIRKPDAKRRAKKQPGPRSLRLTERDRALILFLARAELANRGQIQRLFFPSLVTANRRLRRLTKEGLLRRYRPPAAVGGPISGSHQFLYSLDKRGAALASEALERPARKLLGGSEPPGQLFLEHRLEITQFMICVWEAAGDRLISWDTENALRDKVAFRAGKRQFCPDAYIALELDDGSLRHAFVEIDRGTMRRRAWIRKTRLYQAYYRSGSYHERYLTNRMLLLVVVPDDDRRSWIRQVVQGVEPLVMTFIATWGDIEAHTALGPAWLRYDTGERCRITG